jgi:hypothetical protein
VAGVFYLRDDLDYREVMNLHRVQRERRLAKTTPAVVGSSGAGRRRALPCGAVRG